MSESHLANRGQRRVVDVAKFANAVLVESTVLLSHLVRVAEQPDEDLINADAWLFGACASAQRESRVVTVDKNLDRHARANN